MVAKRLMIISKTKKKLNLNWKDLWSNPFVRFILFFIFLLVSWFSFYKFIYGLLPGRVENNFALILGKHANFFTNLFGYNSVLENTRDLIITKITDFGPTHGTWIGEPCNGVKVMGLFAVFIISFPGPWRHKIWFILLGIIIIHFTNALRISGLTIISAQWPQYLDFNHNVTFQVLIYGIIFSMWYLWVQRFSTLKLNKNSVQQ